MSRTFAISDIHGAYIALQQVMGRSGFSDSDTLIFLGDVCDGWREVRECIDLLSNIKNFIGLLGNHDKWTLDWLEGDMPLDIWLSQGGIATVTSIRSHKEESLRFLKSLKPYHVRGSQLFIHGGIGCGKLVEDEDVFDIIWNRDMIMQAHGCPDFGLPIVEHYGEVFCGHTPTLSFGRHTPVNFSNVWGVDTGASYYGPLTMIDVDSKEFWQSDPVIDLYPGESAR